MESNEIYPHSYFEDLFKHNLTKIHARDVYAVHAQYEIPPTFHILSGLFNRIKSSPVVLCGPLGSGKTTIIKALQLTLANTPYQMTLVSHAHLVNIYETQGAEAIFEAYTSGTLIIDDIGNTKSDANNYANKRNILDDLHLHRYERNRVTHMTTNLLHDDFLKIFSSRSIARLSSAKTIFIKEKNYRINSVMA
jgi:DNA replication protein DnaC